MIEKGKVQKASPQTAEDWNEDFYTLLEEIELHLRRIEMATGAVGFIAILAALYLVLRIIWG